MRKGFWLVDSWTGKSVFAFVLSIITSVASAQLPQFNIREFVLFAGGPNCPGTGQTPPLAPGCGVQIGSSCVVTGGKIGSYNLVKSTGSATLNSEIRTGKLELTNSNSVSGIIQVGTSNPTAANIFSTGSNFTANSNVFVNGSASVGSGSLSGILKHPSIATYSGPVPAGGEVVGPVSLNGLPTMPGIATFDPAGTANISTTQSISEGQYGELTLTGGKTLTFNGPGTYVFSKIKNTGNNNKFIFNFNGSTTGIFRIYVHGDVDLYKLTVDVNGGDGSRIFMETHGTGATSPNGKYAWMIANGASGNNQSIWYGTVWAPYAGIDVGNGSSPSKVIGALWSGTQVVLENGSGITYSMFAGCAMPNANAGPDKFTDCDNPTTQLNGSTTTQNATYSWSVVNGNFSSNVLNPTVSAGGKYVLSVLAPTCYLVATDTAIVNFTPCILPYYPPSQAGKVPNKIGSELVSLVINFGNVADTAKAIFHLKPDSVLIDVISNAGQTAGLKTLLMNQPYGMKDTINNGPNSLIITGWFAINKLKKLDSLASVNYVRPAFPAVNNTGLVLSQGDSAMKAGVARNSYNLDGDSVKVGVISDSYRSIPGLPDTLDVSNGDLPGKIDPTDTVEVVKEYPFGVGTDEGRAMLQIVHDVAPKAKLAFRTGVLTEGDLAQGIHTLADSVNCDVIVDDVTFITAPFFKPGVVTTAVNQAAQTGVTYVTAAGNFGVKSYENIFNPGPPPAGLTGRAHKFAVGDIFQNDSLKGTVLKPGIYTIVLQWEDDIYSLGGTAGTTHDLDIYLTDDNGVTLFGFNRNNLGGDPIEVLPFTVTANTATNILIVDASMDTTLTTSNLRFKYIVFRGDLKINEYGNIGNSTIIGHGNADSAITVGAALYANTIPYGVNPPTPASFTSRGGTPVNNTIRNKPDLVGPNGVNTSVNFGSIDYEGDNRPNFFGTSAAAPHIAGAVALMIQAKHRFANAALTPYEAKSYLTASATDMESAGFDFTTGYGFANVDSAMRVLGRPTPQLFKLELADSSLAPGAQAMGIIMHGNFFSPNTKVLFGNDTLQNIAIVNSQTATATLPAFNDEKLISMYTKPQSLTGRDGGYSDSISITGVVKKTVKVIANDTTKKFGEAIPPFSITVLVDDDSLQHTGLTLADLGLSTNVTYTTNAHPLDNIGLYFIHPARIFNPGVPADAALTSQYNYVFIDGALAIKKLPVTVKPRDTTLYYGQAIGNIHFDYIYDPALNIDNPTQLINNITATHNSEMITNVIGLVNGQAVTIVNGQAIPIVNGQAVTIVNGQAQTIVNGQTLNIVNGQALTIVNGQAQTIVNTLTDSQVDNMSFMVSEASVQNARPIVNNNTTTNVIDITQESILDYNNNNPNQTELLTAVSQTHTRGVVNVSAIINGQAQTIVNGQAQTIVNGQAVTIVNGQAVTIVNGQAQTIVNSLNSTANRTAAIVDQNDTLPSGVNHLKSINLITGLTSGDQIIIPGALLYDNLEVTYDTALLRILPLPITLQARDSSKIYGQVTTLDSTRYKITSGSLQFGESFAKVALLCSGTTATAPVGNYSIIPGGAVGNPGTNPANYNITYLNGNYSVGQAQLTVSPNNATRIYGDANPTFTATYTGFVNGQTFATSGITGLPSFTTSASATSNVGSYSITVGPGTLSSANYSFSFNNTPPGSLSVTPAPLTVKADDKVIFVGDPTPAFTGTITGLKNGDVANYSYAATGYTGSAGVYPIVPTLVSFPKISNYSITLANGNFYVNPKGPGAKKLRPYLDCVEELPNPPSPSRRYVAHYKIENTNATTVYVPVGPDNKLTSVGGPGAFDGSNQRVIFPAGTSTFDVPFDGQKLTYELRTYETNKKTSVASDASSSSNKCSINYTTSARGGAPSVAEVPVEQQLTLYPNPVDNTTIVKGVSIGSEKAMSLFDASGKRYSIRILKTIPGRSIEMDLSSLTAGVYFLQVKTANGNQTLRIVKN